LTENHPDQRLLQRRLDQSFNKQQSETTAGAIYNYLTSGV